MYILSLFYVGVTRARRQIFFSSSQERVNYNYEIKKTYISCLLNLPGIEYNISRLYIFQIIYITKSLKALLLMEITK